MAGYPAPNGAGIPQVHSAAVDFSLNAILMC
jgi:hypothetical protein